ncbi:MAG: hypothetical protein UY75_C0012G0008 [Parcubacteria group bacterium GW2011_GWC2_52_8c]|nr:MAG: hypothetical protein UY75_C0012G0008 [Parcubacteria group bacterium GW2011_GWC2_52_8c]
MHILRNGAIRAAELAAPTIIDVRNKIGFIS